MVAKFLAWHQGNPRELVAVEQELRVQAGRGHHHRPGRPAGARRRRQRPIVVDLKTGSSRPADADLDRNPQLGVYQLAVLLGAFEQLGLTEPGGAELVQVGKAGLSASVPGAARSAAWPSDPDPGWARSWSRRSRRGMAGPVFQASGQPRLPGLPGRPPAARCTSAAAQVTAVTGSRREPPRGRDSPAQPAELARLLGSARRPPSRPP